MLSNVIDIIEEISINLETIELIGYKINKIINKIKKEICKI